MFIAHSLSGKERWTSNSFFFFFNDTATTEIYTLSLHDALPIFARLRETFQFCEQAFAKLDDSKLNEPIQLFGPNPFTRAAAILITVGDWADHYSQEANYLRLNGILPPTAQRRSM